MASHDPFWVNAHYSGKLICRGGNIISEFTKPCTHSKPFRQIEIFLKEYVAFI